MVAAALALAGAASAQVVAPRVQDGELAVAPGGKPFVAYAHAGALHVASRSSKGRWVTQRAGSLAPGAALVAFEAGKLGPVSVVLGPEARGLVVVQGRRRTQLAAGLPAGVTLGWPGLALDSRGLPVIAYTRWRQSTHESMLVLTRIDKRGRVNVRNVTSGGFPKSFVAPPATPLFVAREGARARVLRHGRRRRDDRVASAQARLDRSVHRRRDRRLPGQARSWPPPASAGSCTRPGRRRCSGPATCR